MARTIYLTPFPLQTKSPGGDKKVCNDCPEKGPQPLEMFYPSRSTRDRRSVTCKACQARKRREKQEEREMFSGL